MLSVYAMTTSVAAGGGSGASGGLSNLAFIFFPTRSRKFGSEPPGRLLAISLSAAIFARSRLVPSAFSAAIAALAAYRS